MKACDVRAIGDEGRGYTGAEHPLEKASGTRGLIEHRQRTAVSRARGEGALERLLSMGRRQDGYPLDLDRQTCRLGLGLEAVQLEVITYWNTGSLEDDQPGSCL